MIEDLKIILEQGKSTLIGNNQYLSAKDYIQPFVDRLSSLGATFRCNVKIANQLSITNDSQDVVYNRVHIQAILPESYYFKNNCNKVVGMIYGLDVKSPVAKFYIADIDNNKNLIAFDINNIRYQSIEDNTVLDYSCIKELLETTDVNSKMLEQLGRTYVSKETLNHYLGEWIDFTLTNCLGTDYGAIKLANSVPITGYKYLTKNKDSDYYSESDPTMINIYKAMLQVITDENDLINSFEKTILINKMLGL